MSMACGARFDAVRVVAERGVRLAGAVLAAGGRGPVLADPYSGSWHVFTDPGTMADGPWSGAGMRLLRAGTRLKVPPLDATRGGDLYWYVQHGIGITSARQLTVALFTAAGLAVPPEVAAP
ncbi:hypothetical protein [Streptomyces sp. NPDC091278]|uniref:hypothetical protein n=1 Tax=Streptomyces sp. NPDC091278 TaxID=3155301 RepID=UPI00344DCE7E